jgi:hypothetical protein
MDRANSIQGPKETKVSSDLISTLPNIRSHVFLTDQSSYFSNLAIQVKQLQTFSGKLDLCAQSDKAIRGPGPRLVWKE